MKKIVTGILTLFSFGVSLASTQFDTSSFLIQLYDGETLQTNHDGRWSYLQMDGVGYYKTLKKVEFDKASNAFRIREFAGFNIHLIDKMSRDTMVMVFPFYSIGEKKAEIQFKKGFYFVEDNTSLNDWKTGSGKISEFAGYNHLISYGAIHRNNIKDKGSWAETAGKTYTTKDTITVLLKKVEEFTEFMTDGACTARIVYDIYKKVNGKWICLKCRDAQLDCGLPFQGVGNEIKARPLAEPGIYKLMWLDSKNNYWETNEFIIVD